MTTTLMREAEKAKPAYFTRSKRSKRFVFAAIALSAALIVSGGVGASIVTTDNWLWAAAPTHAYGLIVFVAMDLVVIAALWRRVRLADLGAITLATVQFLAMASDLTGYAPTGVPASAFRSYLLGDTSFVLLLSIQPFIAGLGFWTKKLTGAQGPQKDEQRR